MPLKRSESLRWRMGLEAGSLAPLQPIFNFSLTINIKPGQGNYSIYETYPGVEVGHGQDDTGWGERAEVRNSRKAGLLKRGGRRRARGRWAGCEREGKAAHSTCEEEVV